MFNLINIGERAGSGIPNIYMVWNKQGWQLPTIKESFEPDRITLSLEIKKTADKNPPIKSADKIAVIIEYLTDNPTAKTTEISELIGTSDRRTREILKTLIDKDIISIEGSRKNRVYMLKR